MDFWGWETRPMDKAYLQSRPELSDIEIISVHKGVTKILDIWRTVNEGTANRLGIIRDFDNEPKAKAEHDKYNAHPRICVQTTKEYTLEPEIVKTGNNYELLIQEYGAEDGLFRRESIAVASHRPA